jgi:hypothetical protein
MYDTVTAKRLADAAAVAAGPWSTTEPEAAAATCLASPGVHGSGRYGFASDASGLR